ncbi:hypothetical protein ACI3ET_00005 [Ornithinimicrobium sp. LYQ121]|uniref:hypothetical protein n=1 Tax=Ornithinimicrobium sp. LYQ121 TaxID=3378801 RepID=UPI00385549FE
MRESRFIGDVAEDGTGAAPPADALREVLGRAEKAIAVVDAEGVHQHDLVNLLRDTALQVVIVLRSGFVRGLEVALAVEEALLQTTGSGIRVLAAPWGDSRFPSVVLADAGQADGAYRLAIGRSGRSGSPLAFTAIVDVDQDMGVAVDEWFVRVWDLSTDVGRVREMEQPVFGKVEPEVVAELAARWNRFVEGVRAEDEPAAQEGVPANVDGVHEPSLGVVAAEDPSAPWALFPIDTQGAADEEQEDLADAPAAAGGRTSILAVRPSSPLERDLRDIYARGVLVSVHTSQKVPTFRLDVNAVLGIAESARSGRASLRSPIRLDLLPEAVSEEIARSKRYAGLLLNSHSVVLSEGQHWMPRSVVPHFERELHSQRAPKSVSALLGVPVGEFVTANMNDYIGSLMKVFEGSSQIRV